ncbi:MAG: hypothetical protein HYX67_14270 [Candidatus Melainabacteria bacterium]|nr:hypothetical protein [Candidatus Melainabacteria bacterium]
MDTVAVIFDFDETLMPDSTSALLAKHGIDVEKFWTEQAKALIDQGYDQAHAYLRLILENVGPGKPLGNLTGACRTWFKAQKSPGNSQPSMVALLTKMPKESASNGSSAASPLPKKPDIYLKSTRVSAPLMF